MYRYYGWGVFDAGTTLYPGTVVSISNCVMSPQAATIMAIGTGCPSSADSFGCLAIASTGCTSGALISYTVTTATQFMYVLNGMSTAATNTKMQFTYYISPVSATPSPSVTSSQSPTPTSSTSLTSSASASISSGASISSTNSPTTTPTPSQTPSQTASTTATPLANSFQPDSVLVVRVGDSSYAAGTTADGVAMPVYLDEYSPWSTTPGSAYSSVALPSTCSLATGQKPTGSPAIWFDTTGFPSLAVDGSVAALHCFRVTYGTAIADSTAVLKTILVVRADGTIDASTTTSWPYFGSTSNPISMHNVAMNSFGAGIYTAYGGGCE